MSKLIKTELYKLRTSKLFLILLIIFTATNAIITIAGSLLAGAVAKAAEEIVVDTTIPFSNAFSSPFSFGMLTMFIFISAVSFFYLDFSDGYIKNIAGQIPKRSSIINAKFIAVAVHNLIFFLAAAISNIISGAIIGMNMDTENIGAAIATFCIKWLLSLSICAILMFFAVGLKSKPFALIIAVMISLGAFSLIYMGIDALITNLFKAENFSLSDYMPDTLMSSVNVANNNLVANGIIAAIAFIAAFYILTAVTFKKKDIK